MARLLPETEIRTDEDLIQMLEGIRQVGVAGHDELDEMAGMIRMKIERYARRHGIGRMKARWWGRMVALPLSRCADAMLAVASYSKVCKNRFEAFVTALDDENAGRSDFEVTSRKKVA